jgi:hypothetical protein
MKKMLNLPIGRILSNQYALMEHISIDQLFTSSCRMGVNRGGKLIKRGPVQVVLKEANEKNQLIVRSDDNLGKIQCLNCCSKQVY